MSHTSVERDAVRVLCMLYVCGEMSQTHFQFSDDDDYTHCIDSENRLQKIDFWLRYPDHLAAALLIRCEPNEPLAHQHEEVKNIIRDIVHGQEPDIRWEPMRRYLRGAHEPLDDVLRFLTSRWLVYRRLSRRNPRTCYFLTTKGSQAVEHMIRDCPEVGWYVTRCQLIQRFLGDLDGLEMRVLQYQEPTYAETPLRSLIERIDESVLRSQFLVRFGEAL